MGSLKEEPRNCIQLRVNNAQIARFFLMGMGYYLANFFVTKLDETFTKSSLGILIVSNMLVTC